MKLALFVGALMVFSISAQAAGMWNLEQGVSNYARGGANIANPGDPSAVFLNPAALSALQGFQFLVGANLNWDSRTFERAPDNLGPDGLRTFEPVTNRDSGFPPSPNIFVAYNLESIGFQNLTMGFGLWGPPKTHRDYDELGAQRYSSITTRDLQAHYLLSLAYEFPIQKLRLGASFGGTSVLVDSALRLNVYELRKEFYTDREDPDYDIHANLSATQHWIPTGIVSASVELWEGSTFAISYQLPFDISAPGEANLKVQDGLVDNFGVAVSGKDIRVKLSLPPAIRMGLRQEFSAGSVELAYAWEGWKRTDKISVEPEDIVIQASLLPEDISLETITIETQLRDTYSLRLGGDYQAIEDLLLIRAGTYYERAGIGPKRLNASQFDLDKVGITLGARVDLSASLFLDVAVGYVHWIPQTVTDSKVMFNDPAPPVPDEVEVWSIGNGTYTNTQIITMVALGGNFDF